MDKVDGDISVQQVSIIPSVWWTEMDQEEGWQPGKKFC